jgi:hypothetical protein
MNPSRQRLTRWAARGAIILAALAVLLGAVFTVFVASVEQALPDNAIGWLKMTLGIAFLWGGGGLFFGAILGVYACMIWRDPDV